MQFKKIDCLQDQGSDRYPEDMMIFAQGFPENDVVGVLDGGDPVFIPPDLPPKFGKLTGGQFICRYIASNLYRHTAEIEVDPAATLIATNDGIRGIMEKLEISLIPANIPFASYALAFFGNNGKMQVFQGGDCQIVGQLKNGQYFWTENQTLEYDRENLDLISGFRKKHGSNIEAMWQEFGPVLIERRNRYFNSFDGGFSLMNGQPSFRNRWQQLEFATDKIETIIWYTDGFVDQPATANMAKLAPEIIDVCRNCGLREWLRLKRKNDATKITRTHVAYPETAAIKIQF